MSRGPSIAALAALMCCALAPAGWAASPEEEQLLGCGCEERQLADLLPYSRTFSASGVVQGPLAEATAAAGVPAAAMVEALAALGAGLDLKRDLRDGDRFYVRYERSFTAKGDPIGIGRVLWAELQTAAKGAVSIHRFRPLKGAGEGFWLSTGQSAAAPGIRLPLETIQVSSGYGIRADPFDQPFRGPMPAAAPAAAPKPNPALPPAGAWKPKVKPTVNAPASPGTGGPPPQASPFVNPMVNVPTDLGVKLGLAPVEPQAAKRYQGFHGMMQMHEGVDLAADLGTPIRAAGDGVIIGAELKGGYGNWIEIEHEPGAPGARAPRLATVYGHLSAFAPGIAPGAKVKQGDVIGFVGSTGRSTGPHLHFEIPQNGRPTNPMISLTLRPEQLKGGELARFKQQVARDLSERAREAGSI